MEMPKDLSSVHVHSLKGDKESRSERFMALGGCATGCN